MVDCESISIQLGDSVSNWGIEGLHDQTSVPRTNYLEWGYDEQIWGQIKLWGCDVLWIEDDESKVANQKKKGAKKKIDNKVVI